MLIIPNHHDQDASKANFRNPGLYTLTSNTKPRSHFVPEHEGEGVERKKGGEIDSFGRPRFQRIQRRLEPISADKVSQ